MDRTMKVFELPMVRVDSKKYVEGMMKSTTLREIYDMGFTYTENKEDVVGMVFADISNGHRNDDNIESVSGLVFDVDKYHSDAYERIKQDIARIGIEALIHTTHSHDPTVKKYCYRVLISFSNPIQKEHLEYVGRKVMDLCPSLHMINNSGHLDQAYKKPSQFYYLPSCHPERKEYSHIDYLEGDPLKPDIPKDYEDDYVSSNGVDIGQEMPSQAILSGSEQYLEGTRDNGLAHEVGLLINKGLTKGDVLGQLIVINDMKCKPPLPLHDVKRIADSIWKSHYKDQPEPVKKKALRNSYSIQEGRDLPSTKWLVQNLIEEQTMCAMYGDTGCTKSFLAIDLGMHLALGKDWFDLMVYRPAPVIYVAVEGGGGMVKRINGWLETNKTEIPDNFRIDRDPIYPTNKESINNFIEYYKELGFEKGYIFVDTLNANARADGLNEDGTDMGLIVDAFQVIGRELKSGYMIIHHEGKDSSKGMRGHSSLKASLDTVIHVQTSGSSYKWSIEKLKEGEDQKTFGYEAPVVHLGFDDEGNEITTLVVKPTGMVEESEKKVSLQKRQRTIFKLAQDVLIPITNHRTSFETLIEYIYENWTTHDQDKRRYDGSQVLEALKSKGLIDFGSFIDPETKTKHQEQVWLTKKGIKH